MWPGGCCFCLPFLNAVVPHRIETTRHTAARRRAWIPSGVEFLWACIPRISPRSAYLNTHVHACRHYHLTWRGKLWNRDTLIRLLASRFIGGGLFVRIAPRILSDMGSCLICAEKAGISLILRASDIPIIERTMLYFMAISAQGTERKLFSLEIIHRDLSLIMIKS